MYSHFDQMFLSQMRLVGENTGTSSKIHGADGHSYFRLPESTLTLTVAVRSLTSTLWTNIYFSAAWLRTENFVTERVWVAKTTISII